MHGKGISHKKDTTLRKLKQMKNANSFTPSSKVLTVNEEKVCFHSPRRSNCDACYAYIMIYINYKYYHKVTYTLTKLEILQYVQRQFSVCKYSAFLAKSKGEQ